MLKKLSQQVIKFAIVGLIAFLIDYLLLLLLVEEVHLNYLISATISFSISVIFNYIASSRFVFARKPGMSRRYEFIVFVFLSVIGLGLNALCMWLGVAILIMDYRIVKVGATAIVMVWNFITRKILLEGRL